MIIPDELRKAIRRLHQDIYLETDTLEGLATIALGSVSPNERRVIRDFLTQALDGRLTNDELSQIWRSIGADIFIHQPEGVRAIWSLMRDMADKPPFDAPPGSPRS